MVKSNDLVIDCLASDSGPATEKLSALREAA